MYILNCENGSLYTGYTTDLVRRYQEHVLGTGGCKYTRSFKPLRIAQHWQIKGDKSVAMQVERFIKKLSKKKKEELLRHPESLYTIFPFLTHQA